MCDDRKYIQQCNKDCKSWKLGHQLAHKDKHNDIYTDKMRSCHWINSVTKTIQGNVTLYLYSAFLLEKGSGTE